MPSSNVKLTSHKDTAAGVQKLFNKVSDSRLVMPGFGIQSFFSYRKCQLVIPRAISGFLETKAQADSTLYPVAVRHPSSFWSPASSGPASQGGVAQRGDPGGGGAVGGAADASLLGRVTRRQPGLSPAPAARPGWAGPPLAPRPASRAPCQTVAAAAAR